jgi:hypothetical protein
VSKITDSARGRNCEIRVPGICCGDPEKTVPCHVRLIGISGAGLKAPDIFIAYGCTPCHDYVDSRTQGVDTYSERRAMLLEGMVRTQAILLSKGLIRT